jgi:hypothetical protein
MVFVPPIYGNQQGRDSVRGPDNIYKESQHLGYGIVPVLKDASLFRYIVPGKRNLQKSLYHIQTI